MKKFIKLHALAALIGCHLAINASATIVSYEFSGTINYVQNPSNALPASITYGLPFTGNVTYDTAAIVFGMDFDPSTNSGDFYFSTNGVFSLSVTVGGHTFADAKHASDVGYAFVVIHNDYFGADSLDIGDGPPNVFMDGGPLPGNPDGSGFTLSFNDNSATALSTDALPTTAPILSSFPDKHKFEFIASKNGEMMWDFQGAVTNIVAILPPALNIQLQPNKTVLLSWPLVAQGFNLEQNTNLTAGIGWQTNSAAIIDTAAEHTVTLPASGSMFFRLKTP